MPGGLGVNLANADLSGSDFVAIPSATYHTSVVDISVKHTKGGPAAKLPEGTPMINVQVKVEGGEYDNRRLFKSLIVAPAEVNGQPYEHKKMMDRQLASFYIACGWSEKEVTSKGFDPSPEEIIGRHQRTVVSQKVKWADTQEEREENEKNGVYENEVKGFKRLSDDDASGGGLV